MDAEILFAFAEYMFEDLAERRTKGGALIERGKRREETVAGKKRRVPLAGRRINYRNSEIYRGSDSSFRLTMAVTAYEEVYRLERQNDRGAGSWACRRTAELILSSGCDALRSRFLQGKRGPSRRSDSSSGSRSSQENRLESTVRSQVSSYRKRHPQWRQQFDSWLGCFRSDRRRGKTWYSEQEVVYEARLKAAMRDLQADDAFRAMASVNFARLFHEQRKFGRARYYYRDAARLYKSASIPEYVREAVLEWLAVEIERSLKKEPPGRNLQIRIRQTVPAQ